MAANNALRLRAYLTKEQEERAWQWFGCRRWVWNRMLEERERRHAEGLPPLTAKERDALVATWKLEFPWLCDCEATVLQQSLRDLDRAYGNAFENVRKGRVVSKKRGKDGKIKNPYGFPRFKSRRDPRQSFRTTNSKGAVRLSDNGQQVRVGKFGFVNVHLSREVKGRVTSATLSWESDGTWWVTLQLETDFDVAGPVGARTGVDVNVTPDSWVTLSDGTRLERPAKDGRLERRLQKEQRRLSRKVGAKKGEEPSNRYKKQRGKVAKAHRRLANARHDAVHKATTEVARQSQLVAAEDLNIKGMLSNHSLAAAVSDSCMAEISRCLQYKCERMGRTFVKVDRWYPSSRLCPECGAKNEGLTLGDREWACPSCGHHVADRDANAARNVLLEAERMLAEDPTLWVDPAMEQARREAERKVRDSKRAAARERSQALRRERDRKRRASARRGTA